MTERAIQFSDGTGNIQANNGSSVSVTNILPPEPTRPTRAVHLNPPPSLFIGREPELAALHQHLAGEGSVAYIPGFPGRGKSTLANFYAHQHKDEYQTVHWLPCHSKSLVEIAAEFAWQLELKLDGDLEANLKQLRAHCARNRCLLILDNVDDEAPAGMLLGGRSSILITTWHTNLKFLRPVPAIPLPVFTEDQCLELFRTRIGANEVDRHLAESRLLFERLEHHPFALDIAAGLIREDRRYTIAGMAKKLPADIPALFAEAIATLSPEAQSLLAAMAACAPEGFRLSLAAEVAGFDEDAAFQALNQICSRSLADELDRDTHRYRLHALVRVAAQSTNELRSKHADAVVAQFNKWVADWRGCEQDLGDWRTAFAWTVAHAKPEMWFTANELALNGYALTQRLGRLPESYEICVSMTERAIGRADARRTSRWLGAQAVVLDAFDRLEEAMTLLHRQEALCLDLFDKDGLQRSYGNQAVILMTWNQLDQAMVLLKKKEALCVELGDRAGLQRSYGNQASILFKWGRLHEALALHKQEEAICVQLDDKSELQVSYGNQALVLAALNEMNAALKLHRKVEAMCIELGTPAGLAYCYWQWAETAMAMKDTATERAKLEQALTLFTKLDMPREIKLVQAALERTNDIAQPVLR